MMAGSWIFFGQIKSRTRWNAPSQQPKDMDVPGGNASRVETDGFQGHKTFKCLAGAPSNALSPYVIADLVQYATAILAQLSVLKFSAETVGQMY